MRRDSSVAAPEPMSDRRTVILILAGLTALLGVAVTVVAAISLRDPFTITGELGTRVEISRPLIAAIAVGVLLIVGGLSVVTYLVRTQLRGVRR